MLTDLETHSKGKTSQACFSMWSLQAHKEKLQSCPANRISLLNILGQKCFLQCYRRIGPLTGHEKFCLNWAVIKLCPLSGNGHLKYTLASIIDVAQRKLYEPKVNCWLLKFSNEPTEFNKWQYILSQSAQKKIHKVSRFKRFIY